MIETFKYPVLGFAPAGTQAEIPGAEIPLWFEDAKALSQAESYELKRRQRLGLVVVDCDFRAWKVTSFVDRGTRDPLWRRLWMGYSVRDLAQEFEPLGTMTLEEVRDRILIAMRNDHVYASGLRDSIGKIRKARTIPELSKAIWS